MITPAIEALACSTLIEASMDAVVLINESQHIVYCNPAAEQMFQYPAADIIGQSLAILLPAQLREHHALLVRHYAETGASEPPLGIFGRVRGLRRNGETFPVRPFSPPRCATPQGSRKLNRR